MWIQQNEDSVDDPDLNYRAVNLVPLSKNHVNNFIFYDMVSLRMECLVGLRNRPKNRRNARNVETKFILPVRRGRAPGLKPCPCKPKHEDTISVLAQLFNIDKIHRIYVDVAAGTATINRGEYITIYITLISHSNI